MDERTARASSACERSEDLHVCAAPAAEATCDTSLGAAPGGGTRPTGLPFAGRSPVYAQHGMAATSVPLSTNCALDMLKAGGSAVDAAIAANICEGVVEPMMNGMGGDLMAQVWHGPTATLHGYNGAGRSPRAVTREQMAGLLDAQGLARLPSDGPLPVSTPGCVRGWGDLHAKFGRLPWAELFAPAIRYAEEGHPIAQVIAAEWYIPANTSTLTSGGRYPRALDGFLETFTVADAAAPGGRRAPREGEVWANPALARTLRLVAESGADGFYASDGPVAAAFAAYAETSGLLITPDDLAAHAGEWVVPVAATYRERVKVYELPPNPHLTREQHALWKEQVAELAPHKVEAAYE